MQTRTVEESRELKQNIQVEKGTLSPNPQKGDIYGIWIVKTFGEKRNKHRIKVASCIAQCCHIEKEFTKAHLLILRKNDSSYCKNCSKSKNTK